jgi:ubiquinone/menaquinone biosynthesis C-methylase UbiE
MQPDQEVINRWSASAPFWEKHSGIIRQMFTPITDALVEDAQIGSQQTVLDIATGPGEPALSLAALIGPEGRVYGIDPIPGMVEAARRAADRLGLKNAQFDVAFAEQLPFSTDTFDAVISRFGVMFFRSPVDAVREMVRVLKPGRKLALAVWHFAERNPFHYTLSRVIEQYVDSPPVAPDAPDAFRFAHPGKLTEVLMEAGVKAASERLFQFNIQAPVSVEDYWTLRLEMSEKLREKIAMLSQEQAKEAKREVMEGLREYSTDRGMSFPAEVLIVSGTKNGPAWLNRPVGRESRANGDCSAPEVHLWESCNISLSVTLL